MMLAIPGEGLTWFLLSAATFLSVLGLSLHLRMRQEVKAVRKELKQTSESICQVAEIQLRIYRKLREDNTQVQERLLELSMPAEEPTLPIDKKHQVLTLARRGSSLEEITRKLSVPHSEADLILNLQRYMEAQTAGLSH